MKYIKKIIGLLILTSFTTAFAAPYDVWHVKAIDESGKTLDIKAFDANNSQRQYDVKAIVETNIQGQKMLDIKVLNDKGNHHAHTKVLKGKQSTSNVHDVKGVTDNGKILHIKAVMNDGTKLDIKAFRITKNQFNIKAISPTGKRYAVKAVSPTGTTYDIKGMKFMENDLEMVLGEQSIHGHIKAIPACK